MLVDIPFLQEWENKVLSGQKVCTSRTEKYGKPGDIFNRFGITFELLVIILLPLEVIARYLCSEEGCDGPEHFKQVWLKLHPRKGWVPTQLVWTHFFRRIT